MGGMVTGLLIHIRATARGRLVRNQRASSPAIKVCPGSGRKAQKIPIKKDSETELRLMWNKLGSLIVCPATEVPCIE